MKKTTTPPASVHVTPPSPQATLTDPDGNTLVEDLEQPGGDELTGMEVVKLNITDAAIQRYKDSYGSLTVAGVEDKEGLKAVTAARLEVKKTRVGVEKYAKRLRENAITWQRKVSAEEKRVVGELEALEAHLKSEEVKIETELARLAQEEADRQQARQQGRINQLAAYGFSIDLALIQSLDDERFSQVVDSARQAWEKEEAIKKEAADKKAAEEAAERQRQEKEREELKRLREEAAERDKILAETQRKLDEVEAAVRAVKQAEELAKQQAEQKAIELLDIVEVSTGTNGEAVPVTELPIIEVDTEAAAKEIFPARLTQADLKYFRGLYAQIAACLSSVNNEVGLIYYNHSIKAILLAAVNSKLKDLLLTIETSVTNGK